MWYVYSTVLIMMWWDVVCILYHLNNDSTVYIPHPITSLLRWYSIQITSHHIIIKMVQYTYTSHHIIIKMVQYTYKASEISPLRCEIDWLEGKKWKQNYLDVWCTSSQINWYPKYQIVIPHWNQYLKKKM
jgi:hypothetical protein